MVELHQLIAAMGHQHCVDTNDRNDGYRQALVMPVRFWFKSNEHSCHGVKRRNDSVCKSEIDRFFLLGSKNSAAALLSVSERADLDAAIESWLSSDGPALLEVLVEKEENVFPMVPTGESVSNIRLEP